jgi:hypothetical protein
MATNRNVRFVLIADINYHLFSAVACVKASYGYEQAIWLMGPLDSSASPYQG